ncbi:DUF4221 family protein [Chitinophaga agri]|uniref:DUF4221 domain-containing protein n=1 Tax=Chitinophaga agri TaxID=2703787 RepID=A0A6B9ZIK0_9BACT|nr:DUF4221 family protein [Chitinophaga agri]QHS61886.1 DUF4221 domain-containing protein [Chitinophaga agri]
MFKAPIQVNNIFVYTLFSFLQLVLFACSQNESKEAKHVFSIPDYGKIKLKESDDTLRFLFPSMPKKDIQSMNIFNDGGKDYISIYDAYSETLSIYDFNNTTIIKRFALNELFKKTELYKISIYTQNFDSIFVINRNKINLFDSSGNLRYSTDFLSSHPSAWAFFQTGNPATFKDQKIYTAVRPHMRPFIKNELKNWKILYEFDLKKNNSKLLYNLPAKFRDTISNISFLISSYCINANGRFVISFTGDTCIYETDFKDIHLAHYAQSKFQHHYLVSSTKDLLTDRNEVYWKSDTYGNIYYDNNSRLYLRVAQQGISDGNYAQKNWVKSQSLIILNDDLEVIGESIISNSLMINYGLLITQDGKLYARLNNKERGAVSFIRLTYKKA